MLRNNSSCVKLCEMNVMCYSYPQTFPYFLKHSESKWKKPWKRTSTCDDESYQTERILCWEWKRTWRFKHCKHETHLSVFQHGSKEREGLRSWNTTILEEAKRPVSISTHITHKHITSDHLSKHTQVLYLSHTYMMRRATNVRRRAHVSAENNTIMSSALRLIV